MPIIIAAVIFLLILAVIGAFGYYYYVKPSRLLDQLTSSSNTQSSAERKGDNFKFSFARVLEPIGKLLPLAPQDQNIVKQDLGAAGLRADSTISVFYGSKLVLAAGLLSMSLLLRSHIDNPLLRLIFPIASAGIGYCLPSFILGHLIDRRNERIRLALPDVLDLVVICTEAGCGLDQALVNVAKELKTVHPEVSEELSIVNMEILAGKGRTEALRNLSKRIGEEEIKKLVTILVQTDRFGTSVADALRTQSDYLRIRRRQEAEERAGKVGVKLVFPIFFFCLPSLLVVTAGSGILQLIHNMGSMNPSQ
jgi:tight adherence protein C